MKSCPSCEGIHVGATAKPTPDFYTDGAAFAERTGRLNRWHEVLCFGLAPDAMSGGFFSVKADILLNFVRCDPAYHIIAFASNRYLNQFESGRNTIYDLADGDADPNLVCDPCLALDWHLVFEDAICETFAMLKDIKNRSQT